MARELMRKLEKGQIGINEFWRIAKRNAKKEIKTKADEEKFELRTLREHVFKASDAKIKKIVKADLEQQIKTHKENFERRCKERKALLQNGF
ncbi:MAG: hypothetical protein V1928_03140 [Parcubacteria group bacterium]